LPAGKIAVTVDLHVNFLAPAKGQTLFAKARALQVGGTICVVAVELETEPGGPAPCAVAHVTLRVVDMPPLK
jgi:acyl-coenzyme A thioesterase PaaI-like protein